MSAALSPNVFVTVISANIYKDQEVNGKMDPYVKVTLGQQSFQTSTATDQGQHPKWKDQKFVYFRTKEEKIICELWEDDEDSSDDYIGTAEILIADILKKKKEVMKLESSYPIFNKKEKVADITLIVTVDDSKKIDQKKDSKALTEAEEYSKMASAQAQEDRRNAKRQLKAQNNNNDSKSGSLKPNISVQIVAAKIYKNFEQAGKMDPYFIMQMGQQQFQTTTAQNQGQEPKWTTGASHGFYRYDEQEIVLELWEDDEYTSDDYLGAATIDIEELLSQKPKENKYLIYDQQNESIGEVQLLIQIDMTQVVDLEQHELIIQEAQQKADEESAKNQEARKAKIQQNQLKNKEPASVDKKDNKASNPSKTNAGNKDNNSSGFTKSDPKKQISKDELAKKTSEIQERLGNIQVKLKPNPIVPYIEDTVHKALLEGMKKLAKDRPTNPIRELGMFLVNYEAPR